uniref:Protein NRDE2 homolog n=1 Tax=Musa acuminata subsp. malaccensis TaxID=214687 RepID=A0A804KRA5_MUSAM
MDIARYKIQDYGDSSQTKFWSLYRWRTSALNMDTEGDHDVLDHKLKSGGRYYSAKFTMLERNRAFKNTKFVNRAMSSVIPGDFVPLLDSHSSSENVPSKNEELEESWDDEVIQRTRDFNKMSRDCPHDEKVWLDFAEFQDKIASTQPQKAARMQMLEKKISILEKAVELNPNSEELLLCLLKSYQGRDSIDTYIEKWERILIQHSESCKLWKEFLLVCQGDFSRFKVSKIRRTYAHAIQALSSACDKHRRQEFASLQSGDSSLVQLELGLVDIFVSYCRFEWQAGYQELATGLFQAELEYSLFCPSLTLSSHSKQRLFDHFWKSGVARVGEDGALGWSSWLEKDEQNRQNTTSEDSTAETEVGGWSGWFELSSKKNVPSKDPIVSVDLPIDNENTEQNLESKENLDTEEIPPGDDIEALLKKLGIDIDSEPNSEVKDTETWNKWSKEELLRDSEQWMPIHEDSGEIGKSVSLHSDDNLDDDHNEQLSRVILFEDVSDYLFSLSSKEAHLSLVFQFVDFFGGKVSQWVSTNKSSWIEKVLSLETVPNIILDDLRTVFQLVNKRQDPQSHFVLEPLLSHASISLGTSTMKFLRNAILLFLDIFPRNHMLEEALLFAECLFVSEMKSSSCSINPSRVLAKSLLKKDRQDLLLCGVYAQSEATYGNIDMARKIFDMALLSTDALPVILRARQGFKEQIRSLRNLWARGSIGEHSIAFVCAACLFETLTNDYCTGIQVIEEAFSMVLPERRSQSLQLESLWVYYIKVLERHLKQFKFSRIWKTTLQGYQIYPYNPKSFRAMLQVNYHYSVSSKVRHLFDECCQRYPSVIMFLFALSFEIGGAGSEHRIHSLFEKALANDKLQKSVLLWRCYLEYEANISRNPSAARRIFFRAIHACPWSKRLWLDGFQKLSSILSAKELSDLQEVMRDKELNLRTDIYEILLQDEVPA